MTNVRVEVSEWIRVGVLVAVWSTLLYISKMGLVINWESVKQLPTVVTVYATLSYASRITRRCPAPCTRSLPIAGAPQRN